MIDIQHDSPVPIHEQIASQLMVHIAAGDLAAGSKLATASARSPTAAFPLLKPHVCY